MSSEPVIFLPSRSEWTMHLGSNGYVICYIKGEIYLIKKSTLISSNTLLLKLRQGLNLFDKVFHNKVISSCGLLLKLMVPHIHRLVWKLLSRCLSLIGKKQVQEDHCISLAASWFALRSFTQKAEFGAHG